MNAHLKLKCCYCKEPLDFSKGSFSIAIKGKMCYGFNVIKNAFCRRKDES